MAGAPTKRPWTPRLPAELRTDPDAAVDDDAQWSRIEISGDFASRVGYRMDITECRLLTAGFTGADLSHLRVSDTVFVGCELSGAKFSEGGLTRVEFRECRMRGFSAGQARLNDVRFVDCRLDDADFAMSSGDHVRFDSCHLVGADFYAAKLAHAGLFDSDLSDVEFSQSELAGARLHGSTVDGLRGARYLRGVTIASTQIVPMALQLFGAIGVTVDDDRGPP